MQLRALSILIIAYGFLLIYASLMPFDFVFTLPAWDELERIWSYWPLNPQADISGSDVVSNLSLYIPLGALLSVRLYWSKCNFPSFLAISLCALLSAGIECGQLFVAARVSSASDWLLNVISGSLGAIGGYAQGVGVWARGVLWFQSLWDYRPLNVATLAVMALLSADALAPYIPTILLTQVWNSLKGSHFSLAQGLAEHPWHRWVVVRIAVYMVLACMLAAWSQRKALGQRLLRGALMASGFALCLEVGKLMIVSRVFNFANVVTGWFGCLCAIPTGMLLGGKLSESRKLELGIAALLGYVFYLGWAPFHFTWDPEHFYASLPTLTTMLPLYHYAMGATLNHARLFMQSIFLLGFFVYLLRVRYGWFEGSGAGMLGAILFAGLLGFLQEGGQLFLTTRTPSMTDVYCFALGGGLGAWIPRHAPQARRTEPATRSG